MMITPYIVFSGKCHEALLFYQEVFQSEARILPYGEYVPEGLKAPPEDLSHWVMHAEMQICGTNFWFADETKPVVQGNTVRLTATVPNAAAAQRYFDALCENGSVTLPPTETFYSTFHAEVTDKFGLYWSIVAEESPQQPR